MNDDKMINIDLIQMLRKAAFGRKTIRELVEIIYTFYGERVNSFLIIMYFMKAFDLPLNQVRQIEGAECLGNAAYSDSEIENMLQPLIQGFIFQYKKSILIQE